MSFSKNEAAAPAPLALGARPDRKVEAKAEAKAETKSAKLEALVADDEVSEEPVVRKEEKKASAVPAKKSNLLAMVDDWE
jgi:uncharacterized membrane protein